MGFCPKCQFEYVEGIKVCPDCKVSLVDSLDDVSLEDEMSEDEMAEAIRPYLGDMPDEEARAEIMERIKNVREMAAYKSKEDKYIENKSGAGVLLVGGIVGLAALVLNALGILTFPLRGFSLTLMYVVMGSLFFVFVVSGILAIKRMKELKPEVDEEKDMINQILDFIKAKKADGTYALVKDENYELNFLNLSDKVVSDIEENFEDLEDGFAYYVVDRFANDILDED